MELYLVCDLRYNLIIKLLSEILEFLSSLEYIDFRTTDKLMVRKLLVFLYYSF